MQIHAPEDSAVPFRSTPPSSCTPRLVLLVVALFALAWTHAAAQSAAAGSRPTDEAVAHRRARAFVQGRSPDTTHRPLQGAAALAAARAEHLRLAALPHAVSLSAAWAPVGPVQVMSSSYGLITGRVTAVATDPSDASGNTVYVGTSGGGVWKSSNAAAAAAGVQFKPLTDTLPVFSPNAGTSVIPSLSIGAVSVQPGGTGVVLAGTGDPNDAADSYYGAGLLRSSDNGLTWQLIQNAQGSGVYSFVGQGFAGFAWSTSSPQLVVAAVSSAAESDVVQDDQYPGTRGLYYSADGGATWALATIQDGNTILQTQSSNFYNFRGNAATAVAWNPVRKRFYAAVRYHGYYESTDGQTWTRLANQPGAGLTTTNCPSRPGDYGAQSCPIFRGALAAQPASGDLFALTVAVGNADQGLWQDACALSGTACTSSTVTWSTQLNAVPLETAGVIPQGDYDLALAAVPAATALSTTDTLLFAGTADLYRCSLAGGCALRNTTNTSNGCASPAGVAPAQHAIAWQLNVSNTATPLLYFGNDGGLWRSTDGVRQQAAPCSADDAAHFDTLNGALGSLAEVSSLSSHPTDANTLLVALGGNGSAASTTAAQAGNLSPWKQLSAAESGTVAIDQGNGSVWLAQSGAGIAFHTCSKGLNCTAADFAGVAAVGLAQTSLDVSLIDPPAMLDPVLNTNLITGTCRVWRGLTSGGVAWSGLNAVSTFLAGPAGLACTSADATIRSLAAGGAVQLTSAAQTSGSPVLYAGLSGIADGGSTFGGQIFRTTGGNFASSTAPWTDLTGNTVTNDSAHFNAGGFDISSIAVDPNDPTGHTVYATILGFGYAHVYRSTDAGTTWANISANLPNAPANAVAVDPNNANIVYVAMDTGVYVSTSVSGCIGASGGTTNCWSVLGTALPNAPVLSLFASRGLTAPGASAAGVLRAGTYGRGIWQQSLLSAGAASAPVATFAPASLTFASQTVGTTSAAQSATLTNTGNTSMVIAAVSASAGFVESDTCANTTLAVGASCMLTVSFAPAANGAVAGSVQVVANVSGGYAALPLNGAGMGVPNITFSTASLTFASTAVGSVSASQTVTATNNGTVAATLSAPTVTQDFKIASTTCGASLAVGAGCTITVLYAPTTAGPNAGLLTLADATASHTVALNATATGKSVITVSPVSLLVSGPVGSSGGWLTVTVTNSGTATAVLGMPTIDSQWKISQNTCFSLLPVQSSCQLFITFSPYQVGYIYGTLTIPADGMNYTVALTGVAQIFPNFAFQPSTLTFPATAINAVSPAQKLTFTNNNTYGFDVSTAILQVIGDFGVSADGCAPPTSGLDVGASCTLSVVFSPTAAGTRTGQVSFLFDGWTYASVVTGTGVGTVAVGVSPGSLVFPATNVHGTSAPLSVTLSNTGNSASTLTAPVLTGDFSLTANTCGTSLEAAGSCTLSVVFTPTLDGARTGSLVFADSNGTHTVGLSGNGLGTAVVTLAPSSLAFPSTAVRATAAAQTITVSNSGTAATTLSSVVVTGDFALASSSCGASIAVGASCAVSVTFTPTLSGPRSGVLTLADATATHTVALSGAGVAGVMALSATSFSFPDTSLNTASAAQTLTVTNSGTGALNLAAVAVSGDFSASGSCAGAALAPGKTCTVSLIFTPTVVGARMGVLTLTSDTGGATGTQATVSLAGNGKGAFNVVLTPTAVDFGTQTTGTVSGVSNVTISDTGAVAGAIQSVTVSGDFVPKANTCGASLASQTGCTVSIVFAPSASGVRTGLLTVVDDAGTQTAALTGTGTSVATDTLSPLSLTFATQQVGTVSTAQMVTLTNSGDASLTLVSAQVLSGDFTAVNSCGPTLIAHSSCGITVSFAPKSAGSQTGTLQVSDVLRVQTVALNGTGIAGPGVSLLPASLVFASTGVGVVSAGQTLTLTNNGGVSLLLGAINPAGDFGIVSGSNTCSLTGAIAPAGSCSVQIAFLPSVAGARVGTVTVVSNAATQTAQLTGTGVDFALVANGPTSLTIASGASAVFPLLMRPAANTADKVTYACTGAPANSKCTVVAQYADLSATGTVTVTVLTGTTASSRVGLLLLPLLFGVPFWTRRRRLGGLVAITIILLGATSCGAGRATATAGDGSGSGGSGGTNPVTPTGVYTLTVSATAAGVTHTVPLSLTVQ